MQLDSLVHADTLIHNESGNKYLPTPVTDLCKRVRFRQSECNTCVETCPTDAISLPFGPEISDSCVNCGLCQIACPTETFEGIQSTDQMLRDMLQDQADMIINDHQLNIHCHQAEANNAHSVKVNCLGNMTENSLMAMAGANVQTLVVTTGNCNSCKLCRGVELFGKATSTYSMLADMTSQSAITITIVTKARKKQNAPRSSSTVSRRDFFRSLGSGVAKQAAKVVVDKEQQIRAILQTDKDTIEQKRPSPRREMLKALLDEQQCDDFDLRGGELFPWKRMIVDEVHCVGCGVCVNVCPTGALVKEIEELELTRTINYSLCTNCSVCAESCPQDVIRFEQAYSIGDLVNITEEVVAKVSLNACLICGEIIPTSEGEVCTTCLKRQVVPMFM